MCKKKSDATGIALPFNLPTDAQKSPPALPYPPARSKAMKATIVFLAFKRAPGR